MEKVKKMMSCSLQLSQFLILISYLYGIWVIGQYLLSADFSIIKTVLCAILAVYLVVHYHISRKLRRGNLFVAILMAIGNITLSALIDQILFMAEGRFEMCFGAFMYAMVILFFLYMTRSSVKEINRKVQ